MRFNSILSCFSLLCLLGCAEHSGDTYTCRDIVKIHQFPKTVSLESGVKLPIDIAGCVDVFHVDSLLVCKTDADVAFWRIFGLESGKDYGRFLDKGHGKNEFVHIA